MGKQTLSGGVVIKKILIIILSSLVSIGYSNTKCINGYKYIVNTNGSTTQEFHYSIWQQKSLPVPCELLTHIAAWL